MRVCHNGVRRNFIQFAWLTEETKKNFGDARESLLDCFRFATIVDEQSVYCPRAKSNIDH
jgi:hypothetical protein